LENIGHAIRNGRVIAPGEPGEERADYAQAVFEDRLGQELVRLNPALPPQTIEDTF